MASSLYGARLQGIMVVVYINGNIQSKIVNTVTAIIPYWRVL